MLVFTIIMIVIFSVLDLLALIGCFKSDDRDDILAGLTLFLTLSLVLIYAVSVYLNIV